MIRHSITTAALLVGACATVNATDQERVILIRAKIETFGEVRPIASQGDEVNVGAHVRVRVASLQQLIGDLGSSHVEVNLTMASMPKTDELKDIYVLGRKLPDGSLQALQWNYAVSGLCIPRNMAKANFIEDDLLKLRQSGMIEWNPDCDW